jgi:large conductance mechanosensitive channel
MHFIREFKLFIAKGNVVELAVAVIIGAAFGTIVSSMVDDIITPILLNPALKAANVKEIESLSWGTIKYGNFLSAVIKFIITSVVLFLIVKAMNSIIKKEEANTPAGPTTEQLLEEIRDLLKKQGN